MTPALRHPFWIGPVLILAVWWLAAAGQWISPKLLPTPASTLQALSGSIADGSILADFGGTLKRTLGAFALAAALGVPVGIALGSDTRIYRSLEFAIDFFRSTPATAMFPLFLLIFGIGEESKVGVAAFSAWLVIVFNVAYGVMNARPTRILAARVMGASRGRIFRDVMFFESLPQTCVGLRLGVSYALVVIIVAEMFIGSANGMGRRIIDAQQVFDLKQMYASIIATGCLGYGLNILFLGLERHFVKWAGR
ncbi:MAG: ABC transporter permease [Betaproteobacteria bacterium]|nr:ABC transporter permease [Betaproteobacteria bacterium]